jgi:glycine C-acetyltransferase/8-amino-7-oxononanoate synthase
VKFLTEELKELEQSGLYRRLRTITSNQESHVTIGGKDYISFSSNNYLGLASHPKVKESAINAIKFYGCGAGASRLIVGTMELHTKLEERIAQFENKPAAILFCTGYVANVGVITSIVRPGDAVIIDHLNHASIVDAARLSGAKLLVYPHKDMKKLENILKRYKEYARRLIVTDTVFSMDGDFAPLSEIVRLAKKYDAMTMVDEAHATGVIGETGRGVCEYYGVSKDIDIIMGTLSKAVGSLGGFVVGSGELISYLHNKARSFIYTTALPPAVCAASMAAFDIIEGEPELRHKFWERVAIVRDGLLGLGYNLVSTDSHIMPILIGSEKTAMEMSRYLYENGVLVPGIRYPTVEKGNARLRITVMVTHTRKDITKLLSVLEEAKKIFL